jgi:hypothetical protein
MHLARRIPNFAGLATAAACLALLTPHASAQFDNQWVSFTKNDFRLVMPTVPLTELGTEVRLATGDLDRDGWTDMVAVRKQDFTTAGKRVNVLLLNKSGYLTESTALATASSVPGDLGFNTPTNDRDVAIVDVDGDGWLDFVTATTVGDGDPKYLGHPRVYLNLGVDASGNWLGMRFENARFPQLFSYSTGNAQNPRFNGVAAGDLTGNGYADLYFADHDSSSVTSGAAQPPGADLNNRLLINDGSGFFADESQSRMTPTMLLSSYGIAAAITDLNGDGVDDVVKLTSLQPPSHVAATYNDAANPGFFIDHHPFHANATYHLAMGDLNNDGRIDLVAPDDAADRYRFNTATDAFGRVIWSGGSVNAGGHTFHFLSGGDDGFVGNTVVADLDEDGWNDVLVADVDTDVGGYSRRLHVYHNLITTVGESVGTVIRHERQSASTLGWVGAVGMFVPDLQGTHDIAVFDIDNDGDLDVIVSRRTVTHVFMNNTDPVVCQTNLGFAGPGASRLRICGAPLWKGLSSTLSISQAPANAPAVLGIGLGVTPFPLFGGTLATLPVVTVQITTDASGQVALPIAATGKPNLFVLQALVLDLAQPELFQITNAVQLEMH